MDTDKIIEYADFLNYCPSPNQNDITDPVEVFVRVKITPISWGYIEKKRRAELKAKYQAKFNNLLKEIWINNFDVYIPGYPDISIEGSVVTERKFETYE